ncbi:MAG: hypothetical protein NVS3B21_03420 [Acidimicrobiales bacterium]
MKRYLVDARWRGIGGVGRTTTRFLEGLKEVQPDGRWILWGMPDLEQYCWPGAEVSLEIGHPMAVAGYRHSYAVARADAALFLHAVRPLVMDRSVTLIHDTIPIRFAKTRRRRALWRAHFNIIAHSSKRVLTDSECSKAHIVSDTHISPDRVATLKLPLDMELVSAVKRLRTVNVAPRYGVYIGQIAPHKNLYRLALAAEQSDFVSQGGRIVFLGGTPQEVENLYQWLAENHIHAVELLGRQTDGQLIGVLSGASFLAMPSLEEGLGLPALEAVAAGIPVMVSDIAPFDESLGRIFPVCNPHSVSSISDALDAVASLKDEDISLRTMAAASHRPAVSDADFAKRIILEIEASS